MERFPALATGDHGKYCVSRAGLFLVIGTGKDTPPNYSVTRSCGKGGAPDSAKAFPGPSLVPACHGGSFLSVTPPRAGKGLSGEEEEEDEPVQAPLAGVGGSPRRWELEGYLHLWGDLMLSPLLVKANIAWKNMK